MENGINKFFEIESCGAEVQDGTDGFLLQALDMIQSNIKKRPNGKGYEVALPWIPGVEKSRNNRTMAEKRFFRLEK